MLASALFVSLFLAIQARPADPVAELAVVRNLYSAASFEEALARLGRIGPSAALQDEIDTYRALCLLGLGRTPDAEKIVEQVLHRNPRYLPDEADVSPRLIAVFRSVRARLLPKIAKDLYTSARASFDAGHYDASATELHDLLALVGAADDGGLADLKVLAEGFLRLAEAARAASPATGPRPSTIPVPAPASATTPIYSIADHDVQGPVEITRTVPQRASPGGTHPAIYQGLIEVIIDEQGRVESATIRRSIDKTFDTQLVAATATWRFQPATRNGNAVKYRRSYEIIGYSRTP